MSRRPVIAGNWKMFKTLSETKAFFAAFVPAIRDVKHCDVVVAPPFTALAAASAAAEGSLVSVSGQDLYWEEKGAFTGEVAAGMLVDAGCRYVIVGHSERRQLFGETDRMVELKVKAAIQGGLQPIACVGETLAERDAGQATAVVHRQVRDGLGRLTEQDLSHIIIAYEPVWAIGTGRTATPEIAAEMHAEIRKTVAGIWNDRVAQAMRILYGGSVKPDNIAALMQKDDIDGALVGGASIDASSFTAIVKYL